MTFRQSLPAGSSDVINFWRSLYRENFQKYENSLRVI